MELYVVLLAGGQSSRFWPLEEKNLFTFFSTPLIVYQVKRYSLFFKREKFQPHFIIVCNENNYGLIKKELTSFKLTTPQLVIQTLPDQSGAIISALKKTIKNLPILIVNNNDIFSETLITDFLKQIQANDLILTATKVKSYFPGGYLVRDEQGKIKTIVEKPDSNLVPQPYNLFRFVFDYFSDKQALAKALDKQDLSYEEAINSLLTRYETALVLNDLPFTSLKYPWHVLEATQIFLNNIKNSVVKTQEFDSSTQIVGNVFINEGVKIGSYTKIVGPTYIGKNTIIGDNCLVRNSHIGENCLIGAHSEVARSYLGNQVLLHRNYIGDSVLSEQTSFGANAVTANYRFDEQKIQSIAKGEAEKVNTNLYKFGTITGSKVKVGVGACLMPGVKIQKNSLVSPNETLYKDITK